MATRRIEINVDVDFPDSRNPVSTEAIENEARIEMLYVELHALVSRFVRGWKHEQFPKDAVKIGTEVDSQYHKDAHNSRRSNTVIFAKGESPMNTSKERRARKNR